MVFHFPPISGGGVIVITGIANTLAQLGHDVTIITPKIEWNGEKYHPKLNKNIKIIKVEIPSKSNIKIAARRCYPNMKKTGMDFCKSEKVELILSIFHPFHLVPKAAVEIGNKLNIPTFIKIDDAFYEKSSGLKSIQRKIEKYFNSKTLKNANKIFVANQNTKNEVKKFYNVESEKIFIMPNGIETEKFFSVKTNKKRIIFSGVMYYHRGLDILFDALPKVINEIPDVELILLGVGPEMKKLQKIVQERKLEKNIKFLGWIDRDEIPEYLSKSNLGVGPLRSTEVTKNALPIKILEYMAASLPIIAFENTLSNQILNHEKNGFNVKNTEDLSKKIILLLKDKKLQEEFGNMSKNMIKKYDWNVVINEMLNKSKN
jgi:glycosyltransferase involved in cell wall biosynthesis